MKTKINLFWGLVFSLVLFSSSIFAQTVTYFAPQTDLEKVDIKWLQKAFSPRKLYIAMYSFTDKNLAKEVIELANSGVEVFIYRDDKQMDGRTDVTKMFLGVNNIHIKAKNDKGFWNIMHNKMFVIPGIVYREGSANWSPSAEGASCYHGDCGPIQNQDNNATFISDKTAIDQALGVFKRMWDRESNIVVQN